MSTSFMCQKCKQPLELDASLADLTPSSYDLLASSFASPRHRSSEKDKLAQVPAPERVKETWKRASTANPEHISLSQSILSARAHSKRVRSSAGPPNESFVFLQDSVVQRIPSPTRVSRGAPSRVPDSAKSSPNVPSRTKTSPDAGYDSLSHKLYSSTKLFTLLSNKTDIDHPLCTDCTDSLLRGLDKQLKDIMRERDGYLAFEKELKKERQREDESPGDMERRIERLKEEEKLAIEDLREAQREKERLEEDLRALELEEKELEEEENE